MPSKTTDLPGIAALASPYPRRGIDENLRLQAEQRPLHPALAFYGREIGYGALWHEVEALAGFLASQLGVGPGHRVALDLQNSPQFIIGYYAVLRAGAAVVPLNPMYRAEEVSKILNDSAVEVVIAGSEVLDRFTGWPGAERLRLVVAHYADYLPQTPLVPLPPLFEQPQPDIGTDARLIAWSTAIAQADVDPNRGYLPALNSPETPCVMPYTSGSTGQPKGCPHTHAAVMHTAAAQAEWYGFSPESVVTAVQPLFHVAGMQGSMNAGLYAGATLLVMTRWDAKAAITLFAHYGVTFFNAPPTMVIDLMAQEEVAPSPSSGSPSSREPLPTSLENALGKVTTITGGGAAMPVAVAAQLKARFGLVYVEGYGMSETMSPTHLNPKDAPLPGSIGVPIQQTVSRVVDPDTLLPLPDGEVGEILVAGPQVLAGYWRNPEADASSFANIDGLRMLRTGDLGFRDADGYFHIVDRLKRMINASGFKVWPSEVENHLFAHEAVQQCCVIAAPDPYRGETVKAMIVLKPLYDGKVSPDDIIGWARERLAAYKVPRQVEFVHAMPLTASHKIDWRAVQAENAARMAAMA